MASQLAPFFTIIMDDLSNEHADALSQSQRLRHLGQYTEALQISDSLKEVAHNPLVAFERARILQQRGYPGPARDVIDVALKAAGGHSLDVPVEEPGHALLVSYLALLSGICGEGFREARKVADGVMDALQQRPDSRRAVTLTRLVHMEIYVSAFRFHEIFDLSVRQDVIRRLGEMIEVFVLQNDLSTALDAISCRYTILAPADCPQFILNLLSRVKDDFVQGPLRFFLASAQKTLGMGLSTILEQLDLAQAAFDRCGHPTGRLGVKRLRLLIDKPETTVELVEALIDIKDQFMELDYITGALKTLSDLVVLLIQDHRFDGATLALSECDAISQGSSMRMQNRIIQLNAVANLLCQRRHSGDVVKWCKDMLRDLESQNHSYVKAHFTQSLGLAYLELSMRDNAIEAFEGAYKIFDDIGAVAEASSTATRLSFALDPSLAIDHLSEADRKAALTDAQLKILGWVSKDERASDALGQIKKLRALIVLHIQNRDIVDFADCFGIIHSWLSRITVLMTLLPDDIRPLWRAQTQEMERIALLCRKPSVLEASQIVANLSLHDTYDPYSLIGTGTKKLGLSILNASSSRETRSEALEYFLQACSAANTEGNLDAEHESRYWIALTLRECFRNGESGALQEAINHLEIADALHSQLRREMSALPISDLLLLKNAAVAHKYSLSTARLAIEICVDTRSEALTWSWVQRIKARALSDLLGMSITIPARLWNALDEHSLALFQTEKHLRQQLNKARPFERLQLHEELQLCRAQMDECESLRELLDLRDGAPLILESLYEILMPDVICIDYVVDGQAVFMLVVRSERKPEMFPLKITVNDILTWKQNYLNINDLQHQRRMSRVLKELTPLVSPLRHVSEPDDVLIICPTGPIHGLPLHAVPLEKQAILERNAVVYIPSLAVLRLCKMRAEARRNPSCVVIGNPTNDRPRAGESASQIAAMLASEPVKGDAATKEAFRGTARGAGFIYFHGHAIFDYEHPLRSAVQLSDGDFTASDMLELPLPPCDVTIIACSSGSQFIARGDEPMGLVPALLVAGATSVLATLWPIDDDDGAEFSKAYHSTFQTGSVVDLAREWRNAALAIRSLPDKRAPYHWASFALNGYWQRAV